MFRPSILAVSVAAIFSSYALSTQLDNHATVPPKSEKKSISAGVTSYLNKAGTSVSDVVLHTKKGSNKIHIEYLPSAKRRYLLELNETQFNTSKASKTTQSSAQIANRKTQQSNLQHHLIQGKWVESVTRNFTHSLHALEVVADQQQIAALQQHPSIVRIHPEKIVHKSLSESVDLINAPQVWETNDSNDISLTGVGVTVGIIDTGIDYSHSALGGCFGEGCRVRGGYDFAYNDDDPMDVDGHGTHVAGIVGANNEDIKGVAPDVQFYALKALGDEGFGSNFDVIRAIEYSMDPDGDPSTDDRLDVINLSLGGPGDANDAVSLAVDAAVAAGIIVVVAAGNDGNYGDIQQASPAAAKRAITVASTTKQDTLSSFSSKGDASFTGRLKPEISAPGSDIYSSMPNGEYASLSGTSMASPHVAGAAALLRQANPELSPEQVAERLMAASLDLGLNPFEQGAGRLDIMAAIAIEHTLNTPAVGFGTIDKTVDNWQVTQTLALSNLSDEAQIFNVTLPQNLPQGVEFSISETEFELAGNTSKQLTLLIQVPDPASLDAPTTEYGAHLDSLTMNNNGEAYSVPISFENPTYLTFTNQEDSAIGLNIDSTESNFAKYFITLAANESRRFKVPKEELSIYTNMSKAASHVDGEYYEATNLKYIGLQTMLVTDDVEAFISLSDNSQHFGLKGIELPATLPRIEQIKFPDQQVSVSSGSAIYGLHSLLDDKQTVFVLPENVEDNQILLKQPIVITHHASGLQNYAVEDEQLVDSVYTITQPVNQESMGKSLYTVSLDSDPYLPFKWNTNNDAQASLSVLSKNTDFDDLFTISAAIEVTKPIILRQVTSASNATIQEFSINDGTPDSTQFITTSIGFDGENWLITPLQEMGFSGLSDKPWDINLYGTYFTGTVLFANDEITISNNNYSENGILVNDIQQNQYGLGVDKTMVAYCGDQVADTIAITSLQPTNFNLNAVDCSVDRIKLLFESKLIDEAFVSSFERKFENSQSLSVSNVSILSLALFEGSSLVLDQTVNKLDARLQITFDSPLSEAENLRVKYADSDWLTLDLQAVEGDLVDYAYTYEAKLPMVEEEQVVTVTFSKGDDTNYQLHTLNGLFRIGANAGEDNDVDSDGIPNNEDDDSDNDGVNDDEDEFKYDPSEAYDTDQDGVGNNADEDDDNDGISDGVDAFPLDPTEFEDNDNDGIGNNADLDDDNDGTPDTSDAFPLDSTESVDTDGDGIGNNADLDDDNDGTPDTSDAFPLDSTESVDTDGDGIGNNADLDDDNDGAPDTSDAFPLDPSRQSTAPAPISNATDNSSGGGSFNPAWLLILLICRRWFDKK